MTVEHDQAQGTVRRSSTCRERGPPRNTPTIEEQQRGNEQEQKDVRIELNVQIERHSNQGAERDLNERQRKRYGYRRRAGDQAARDDRNQQKNRD